jgi:hypothetical protein
MVITSTKVQIIFYIIFIIIKGDMITNPINTGLTSNNIDFKITLTSDKIAYTRHINLKIKINQDENNAKIDEKSYLFSPSCFLCIDRSNNKFFLLSNNYYKVEQKKEIMSLSPLFSFPTNINYLGYIAEKQHDYYDWSGPKEGYRCEINNNEIIIYGIKDNNIYFYYILENKGYQINNNKVEELYCKLLQSDCYMCVYTLSNKIYINIISHQYKKINNKIVKDLAVIGEKTFSQFDYYHKPILYDTENDNKKLLCAIKDDILCHILKIDVDFHIVGLYFSYTINIENIYSYSATLLMNKDNCYFIEFNSEYLFCCANKDKILCQRKKKNLELIKNFEINPQLQGKKYNLTIENNKDHAILNFINEKNKNEIYLYKYYIYLPECGDSIKEVENFENVELELLYLLHYQIYDINH